MPFKVSLAPKKVSESTSKSSDQQALECKERIIALGRRHEVTSTARGSIDAACQRGASRALKEIVQLLLDNRKLVASKGDIRYNIMSSSIAPVAGSASAWATCIQSSCLRIVHARMAIDVPLMYH